MCTAREKCLKGPAMASILRWMGWLLIAFALIYVAVSGLYNSSNGLLPAGILVAIGTQLLVQAKNAGDTNEKRSFFHLESCVLAYEEAAKLLLDGNNDRGKWVEAGRALAHAKTLATGIVEDSHYRVLALHQLKYRGIFHDVISDKPASFFYGAPNPSIPTDDAAKLSTAPERRGDISITSTLKELYVGSIRAVWESAQWPADYQDPLEQKFSDEERGKAYVLFPGLYEFLVHKDSWHSAGGKLYPKQNT